MCFLIQHQCRFAKPLYLSRKSHTTPTVFHLLGHLHFHWRQPDDSNVITGTSKTRQLKSRLEIWGWNKEALKYVWNMTQEKKRYILLPEPCSVSTGREREEKQPYIRKRAHWMYVWMNGDIPQKAKNPQCLGSSRKEDTEPEPCKLCLS